MARTLKAVQAPRPEGPLTVTVDPLKVARGHRKLPRGGVHATARKPTRARAKDQIRRQLAREGQRPSRPR